MCAGALLAADIDGLVFALADPAAVHAAAAIASSGRGSRAGRLRVVSGILADEAAELRPDLRVARRAPPAPDRRSRRMHDRVPAHARPGSRASFAILCRGEVSEWLMVPLSKSGVRKHRGFESHPLRHPDSRPDAPADLAAPGEVA